MLIEINERARATILAALRLWQWLIAADADCGPEASLKELDEDRMRMISDIASGGGTLSILHPGEIDNLCQEINMGGMEEAVKYYVLAIRGMLDYEQFGPFATQLEQHEEAVNIWKDCNPDADMLLFMDERGATDYCVIPLDFLNNPAEELARLKAQPAPDELAARLRRYVQSGGASCPFCAGVDTVGDSYEHEEGYVTQDVTCSDCGKTWRDTLTLTSVTPLED